MEESVTVPGEKIQQTKNKADYYAKFYSIWLDCIANGYSTNDARDFAEMELTGNLFHNN